MNTALKYSLIALAGVIVGFLIRPLMGLLR